MSRRDIIGKEPGQPERIIAQVHHHFEAAVTTRGFEIGQDVHHVAVALIVVPVYAPRAISLPEVEQQCRQVVSEIPILNTGTAESMANQYVKEERFRGDEHRSDREQSFEQIGRVQQLVRTLRHQPPFQIGPPVRGAAAQQQHHQLQVRRRQTAAVGGRTH